MFFRIRLAFGLALLLTLIMSITAFAKGNYAFLIVTGPNLRDEVRITDPALTTDFFAFSVFYEDKTDAPSNPGAGYEITRFYIDNGREHPFDRLHYYPATGFVYYDGIANGGQSEYDGKWYTAKPEIKTVFENALSKYLRSGTPIAQAQPTPFLNRTQSMMLTVAIAGFVVIMLFASRFRKPVNR